MRQPLADAVADLQPALTTLARELHADPETAFEEVRAAGRIATLLAAEGVEPRVGVHGLDTAVRAEVGSDTGRTIAILAEYDALPGIGHACGHNVIAATGVGAFLALARLAASDPDAVPGRVVLLGTPAEEGHTGKEYLAREGAFDGLDAAIMLHPYAHDLADHVWLGRRTARVTFSGVAAHASSEPEKGRNALDAATLFYTGIGLFRQQMTPGDRVHAIVADGGTRASIIPEAAALDLYVRSPGSTGWVPCQPASRTSPAAPRSWPASRSTSPGTPTPPRCPCAPTARSPTAGSRPRPIADAARSRWAASRPRPPPRPTSGT